MCSSYIRRNRDHPRLDIDRFTAAMDRFDWLSLALAALLLQKDLAVSSLRLKAGGFNHTRQRS